MKRLLKMKNKKGFTLIEIIVVLVIIAILAAVSVPALLGYVEEARGKAYINEARAGMTAAQAVVTEAIASGSVAKVRYDGLFLKDDTNAIDGTFLNGTIAINSTNNVCTGKSVLSTTTFVNMVKDVKLRSSNLVSDTFLFVEVNSSTNRVTGLVYFNGEYAITIKDGTSTVLKTTSAPSSNPFTDPDAT